jgi:hypothetical protein
MMTFNIEISIYPSSVSVSPSLGSPLEIIVPLFRTENSPGFPIVASINPLEEDAAENREDVIKETPKTVEESRQFSVNVPDVQEKPKLNVLEVLKGMGSAFQLLIRQPNPLGDSRSDATPAAEITEDDKEKYRQQAEHLRGEINKRSGQLQKVVGAAIEGLTTKNDVVVKKILENLQTRLGQAKLRADKILKEPESGELAVKTLNSINQGMGNLGALVQHVLSRVNISINVDLKEGAKSLTNTSFEPSSTASP